MALLNGLLGGAGLGALGAAGAGAAGALGASDRTHTGLGGSGDWIKQFTVTRDMLQNLRYPDQLKEILRCEGFDRRLPVERRENFEDDTITFRQRIPAEEVYKPPMRFKESIPESPWLENFLKKEKEEKEFFSKEEFELE